MRLGILIAAGIAILLNVTVMLLLQAAHVPAGVVPAAIPKPPSMRRHGIVGPAAPLPRNAPAPESTAPSSQTASVILVLGAASLAAGGSLLALGVLTVLILRSGKGTSGKTVRGRGTASVVPPAGLTQPVSGSDTGWQGTVPPPRRDLPPIPTLVIPESLAVRPEAVPHPETEFPSGGGIPEQPEEDRAWIGLARECVDLFDEMDRAAAGSIPADHVRSRLQELLERSGVDVIENDTVFQRTRHQVKNTTRMVADGTPIRQVVSPGFAIDALVLRRAMVRIAD